MHHFTDIYENAAMGLIKVSPSIIEGILSHEKKGYEEKKITSSIIFYHIQSKPSSSSRVIPFVETADDQTYICTMYLKQMKLHECALYNIHAYIIVSN